MPRHRRRPPSRPPWGVWALANWALTVAIAVSALLAITAWAAELPSSAPSGAGASTPAAADPARAQRAALLEARLSQLRGELNVNLVAQQTATGAVAARLRQREDQLRAQIAQLAAQIAELRS